MITLNQLIILYKDIAARHEQVHSFEAVQDFNISADNAPEYPLLVVSPTGANLPRTDNGYSSFTTTFDLQVIDLVNKDDNNRMDVLSDTQQIINDVVNEFNTHPYYLDSGIDTINDISFEPLRGVYDDDVDGWKVSMTLEHPNKLSFCGNPIENLSGFDFTPASVEVTDGDNTINLFPSEKYTCESSEPKSGTRYNRDYFTFEDTSHAVYDDADQVFNRTNMDFTHPSNPLVFADLDLTTDPTGNTMLENNEFGNKIRFTKLDGTQKTSAQGYCIDHYLGLGFDDSNQTNGVWNNQFGIGGILEGINTSNRFGFNDWFAANFKIANLIWSGKDGKAIMLPYLNTTSLEHATSTLRGGTSTSIQYIRVNNYWLLGTTSSTNIKIIPTRVHYK